MKGLSVTQTRHPRQDKTRQDTRRKRDRRLRLQKRHVRPKRVRRDVRHEMVVVVVTTSASDNRNTTGRQGQTVLAKDSHKHMTTQALSAQHKHRSAFATLTTITPKPLLRQGSTAEPGTHRPTTPPTRSENGHIRFV